MHIDADPQSELARFMRISDSAPVRDRLTPGYLGLTLPARYEPPLHRLCSSLGNATYRQ